MHPVDAQDAVLRDNLFGLELDPRCVQIAMFAVALQAWKAGGGWRQLPVPNIACSGIPVKAPVEEWKTLAGRRRATRERARPAPRPVPRRRHTRQPHRPEAGDRDHATDGSAASLEDVEWDEIAPRSRRRDARSAAIRRRRARGGLQSHSPARRTSVAPIHARRYQSFLTSAAASRMRSLLSSLERYPWSRGDLAVAVLERVAADGHAGGTVAASDAQNWLSLRRYHRFREHDAPGVSVRIVARLGPVLSARSLVKLSSRAPVRLSRQRTRMPLTLDCLVDGKAMSAKAQLLADGRWHCAQLVSSNSEHPDARVIFGAGELAPLLASTRIIARDCRPATIARFGRLFWELPDPLHGWEFLQSTYRRPQPYGGRDTFALGERRGSMVALRERRVRRT